MKKNTISVAGRESNWELLRIIAMLLIVAGHFFEQSGYTNGAVGTDLWLANIMGSGSRIAVNLFLILGVWFMVDAKFRAKRILKFYGQVWGYTFALTVIVFLLGGPIPTKDIIRGVFPILGKAVWFASTYFVLLIVSPWLQKILAWDRVVLRNFLIVLSFVISGWVTIYEFDRMEDQWLDCFIWFMYAYLIIGYYKHYLVDKFSLSRFTALGSGLLIYIILVAILTICTVHSGDGKIYTLLHKLVKNFLVDFKSIPNFACSLLIFYFFQHLDLKNNRIINYVSSAAFGVYIIHQTPAVIPHIWKDLFQCDTWISSEYSIFYAMMTILGVYIGCLVIDRVRCTVIEPLWMNSRLFAFWERKIDGFYSIMK